MQSVLIFVLIVVVLAAAAFWVISKSIPPEMQMVANFVVGVLALFALATKLLPMAGL